jgi:pimeloyl-ACP methyl ester carboxylesterase
MDFAERMCQHRMTETMIQAGDATICTESFGQRGDPAVLLIMGQMASMLWWPAEFCERLAAGGRFVIRYDHRDTGRSTGYEPGRPGYTPDDLVADALAVLDGYGIERAHVVGMSMGGMIAQLLVLAHRDRVTAVTAISTTTVGPPDPALPGPDAAYLEHAATAEHLDWSDVRAVAEFFVSDARAIAGTRHPFDEAATRAFVDRDLERTLNPASLVNHALLADEDDPHASARDIDAPFAVIHGTADPLFPHEHGVALAEAVPGAWLVSLEGGGHEVHEGDWAQLLEVILRRGDLAVG